MHKNTFLLVLVLAVFAALLVGFHIGRTLNNPTPSSQEIPEPTISFVTPTPEVSRFTSTICGITVTLPTGTVGQALATNSARFVSSDGSQVMFGCDKDIPALAIPTEDIERLTIASVSAKLYHSKSAKDGTKQDALIFTHPDTGMDVLFSGFGATFSAIIRSIELVE